MQHGSVDCYGFPGFRGYPAWLTAELHAFILPTSLLLTLLLMERLWLAVGAAAVVLAHLSRGSDIASRA